VATRLPAGTKARYHFGSSERVLLENDDGKPDLVVANVFGGTVSVLLGTGDGTFGTPPFTVPGSPGPRGGLTPKATLGCQRAADRASSSAQVRSSGLTVRSRDARYLISRA
jgi:hypothetical protein